MTSLDKENKRSLLVVTLSLISVIGINITIKTNDKTIFGNSLYSLLAFIAIFLVINKSSKNTTNQKKKCNIPNFRNYNFYLFDFRKKYIII